MILYFYYPKSNRSYFKYLIGDLKDYNEKFFTSLYDSFNEVGIPEKIYFNNRKLYAYSFNTLKALKIECEFLREERHVDQNMNDLLSNLAYYLSDMPFYPNMRTCSILKPVRKIGLPYPPHDAYADYLFPEEKEMRNVFFPAMFASLFELRKKNLYNHQPIIDNDN